MDIGTILGLALAFGALGVAFTMEGGSLRTLVSPAALLIVFGGSLGAAMVALPLSTTLKAGMYMRHALFARSYDPVQAIRLMGNLARIARKGGVLALEGELVNISDPFVRRGVQLVVDGTDAEVTEEILETEIEARCERHDLAVKFFSTLGGLAPTLGVTGTVMGLVHMLGQLSEPGKMGPAIAGAFLATLYGVGSANLIFVPVAAKLKLRSEQERSANRLVLLGVTALQAGDSPIVLVERLKAFLSPAGREAADRSEQGDARGEPEGGEPVGAQT